MTDDKRPRRASDDEGAPRSGMTPSRAFQDSAEDPDATAVRPALNPDWYRSGEQRAAAASDWDEQPWRPEETTRPAATATDDGAEARSERERERGRRHLRTAFLLTAASTVLPGSGLLGAKTIGPKIVGALTSLGAIGGAALVYSRFRANPGRFIAQFTDPAVLQRTMLLMIAIGLVWALLIAATNVITRPAGLGVGKRALSAILVAVLAFAVAAPSALAARYSRDTTLAIEKVAPTGVEEVKSTTRPTLEDHDPWANVPRINILILGADGSVARAEINESEGIRTDTIMVASIDTATGDMTLVQIPRNVQYTPFPPGSEMAELYPDGFRGEGQAIQWHVNAIWKKVDYDHPELFTGSTYRGAEALKQGVQGITGLKIDYFAMLNMDGVQELINAMGGVTVNINDRYPMGVDRNPPWSEPSSGWLEKGPNQRLDGFQAMWFARSRSRHSDYDRMARQSCLIGAVVDQANPPNLLQRFEAIASASSDMIVTDIPQRDFPEMVELAFRVKDGTVNRMVFSPGKNGYAYEDPDFDAMRQAVKDAIEGPKPSPTPSAITTTAPPSATPSEEPSGSPSPSPSPSASESPTLTEGTQDVVDACAYRGD